MERYTDPQNKKIKELNKKRFNDITRILTGALSDLVEKTSKYRNRLIHDGILDIEIDKETGRVFLPDNPLAPTPIFRTELVPHVESVFLDLQNLLRDIYAQMIIDIDSKGSIPLIT